MDIEFDDTVTKILDVGGGKFDNNAQYMWNTYKIELLVWDPYNRTEAHNNQVRQLIHMNKVKVATSMSVLNVIPNLSMRLAHIITVYESLINGGKAYFKIWPGEEPYRGTGIRTIEKDVFQANAFTNYFIDEVEIIFGLENAHIHDEIDNLIVGTKKYNIINTSDEQINFIQQKSRLNHATFFQEIINTSEEHPENFFENEINHVVSSKKVALPSSIENITPDHGEPLIRV